jgi:hypothetical protein
MDRERAEQNLELIRTLMERTTRYEHLSARAGLQVGVVAIVGSASFYWLDATNARVFTMVWGVVLLVSLAISAVEHIREVRAAGAPLWSRPAREIVRALLPAFTMATVLTVQAYTHHRHLELPGIWMLCYGCGALATFTYAPPVVCPMGIGFLVLGAVSLWLGAAWSTIMMGIAFGGGHLLLGAGLLASQRRTVRQIHSAAV